jgi:hypothetical protein
MLAVKSYDQKCVMSCRRQTDAQLGRVRDAFFDELERKHT